MMAAQRIDVLWNWQFLGLILLNVGVYGSNNGMCYTSLFIACTVSQYFKM